MYTKTESSTQYEHSRKQAAIAELPHDEFWLLMERLDDLKNERWDEEMARDVASGRFDEIIARGKQDIAEGRGRPI